MRSARAIFCFFIFALVFSFFLPEKSLAQTPTIYPSSSSSSNSYNAPNLDTNVPRNQHTYTQSVTIEVLSAIMCQISGIDPIDPSTPCLGINPVTKKLGYAPQPPQGQTTKVGGIAGNLTDMIAYTYTPTISTGTYTQYLSDNFGIVKKSYAATPKSYGFEGLKPVLSLWIAVRNIAYALLVFAFAFIGVGIMLRVKIDPRTVMTIQNQIPKVIIGIILITFSYAIAAVLVDLMWVTTYAGVNMISTTPEARTIDAGGKPLATKATEQLLEIPLIYVNGVFHTSGTGATSTGIAHITGRVSTFMGNELQQVIKTLFGVEEGEKCFKTSLKIIPTGFNLGACVAGFIGFLANIVFKLVIFVVIIVALFKIWFNLLKAYVYTLLYVIVAPIMIVFGLLPSKPMGFENWLRRFFVNIAVFPLTAFILVGARVLMDTYTTKATSQPFIPPLIGHDAGSNFGVLIAFGAILLTPHIQTILQEKMGVKGIGSPGLIGAGFAGGAAVVGAPVGRAVKHLNRTDQRGQAVGSLALAKKTVGNKVLGLGASLHVPFTRSTLDKRLFMQNNKDGYHSLQGYKPEAGFALAGEKGLKLNETKPGYVRSHWRERQARKSGSPPTGTATSSATTQPGRFKRMGRKMVEFMDKGNERGSIPTPKPLRASTDFKVSSTLPASHPGSLGTPTAGAGGGSVSHGTDGNVTITGPVTATGQVIGKGATVGEAKQHLIKEMYKKHQESSGPSAQPITGTKLEHVLKDVGDKLEHLSTPEQIGGVTGGEWTVMFKEAEEKHKNE